MPFLGAAASDPRGQRRRGGVESDQGERHDAGQGSLRAGENHQRTGSHRELDDAVLCVTAAFGIAG